MYTDMKDKKSYMIVYVQRYERQEILHDCGCTADLCRSFHKVRWYKTMKGGGGGVGTQREQRGIILSFKNVKGGP